MNTYIKFIEHCDHEGETWRFYLPKEGNEAFIEWVHLVSVDDEHMADSFEIQGELPESEVDILVKHTRSGYMDYENKVEGIVYVARLQKDYEEEGDATVVLYKAGIEGYIL